MEDKIVQKFINKFKDKFSKNKTTYPSVSEYAFSTEEIETINKQNKQKIQELKQDIFSTKKEKIEPNKTDINDEILSPIVSQPIIETGLNKEMLEEYSIKQEESPDPEEITEEVKELISPKETIEEIIETTEEIKEEQPKNSFINLNPEHQKLVMEKWNAINLNKIDKDIIDGKDLLNHNYTITYADDAAKFIHHIRKEYEIVICYLIGFNNEKQGIFEKTIFSNKIDEEWKYLNNYIKILEKIRSFKK